MPESLGPVTHPPHNTGYLAVRSRHGLNNPQDYAERPHPPITEAEPQPPSKTFP